jgi:deoxyribodipyrimidine photolyase
MLLPSSSEARAWNLAGYPEPIIDHKLGRKRVLAAYARLRKA